MTKYTHCVDCRQPFTSANVRTREGWSETQISGLCEDCFDAVTADDDDAPMPFIDDNEAAF